MPPAELPQRLEIKYMNYQLVCSKMAIIIIKI